MRKKVRFLLKEIFTKRVMIFRWQLNLFATVCVCLGIVLGGYVGIDRLTKIFAINDAYSTWGYNQDNSANYTYDSSLINVGVNSVSPGVNRLTNNTFETDLTGWSGTQTYTLNDEFTTDPVQILISDSFGRTDGTAIGTADTGGAWVDNNNTWTITSGAVKNTPVGTVVSTDGGMENWNSATDLTSWAESIAGTSTVNREATEKRSGNYAVRLDVDASANMVNINQGSTAVGTWYSYSLRAKALTGNPYLNLGNVTDTMHVTLSTTYAQYFAVNRATVIAAHILKRNAASNSLYIDDYSAQALTLPSLFTTTNTSTPNVQAQSKVTVAVGTQAGIILNLDSTSNPQNFRLVYTDRTNIYIDNVVNGVYTNKQTIAHGSGTLAYADGKVLSVVDKGTSLTVTYGGVIVGSTQAMTTNTNTKHGLFSTYSGNTFDDVSVRTLINGTLATDGINARTAIDTTNVMNISNGKLNIAPGVDYGNPGVWYPSITRGSGKVLVGTLTISVQGYWEFGFDNDQSGDMSYDIFWYDNSALNFCDGGSVCRKVTGSLATGTYSLAVVLRTSGAYYYIKGGTYTNWTLLWIGSIDSTVNLFPAIGGNTNATFTGDDIRIPTSTWLPTPLASDGFSGATTDGLGHTEANGGSGLTWTGSTWSISGGTVSNTPATGNELLSDTGLEGTYTAGLNTNLTKSGTPSVSQSADVHGGTKAQAVTGTVQADSVRYGVAGLSGRWWVGSLWGKRTAGTNGGARATLGLTGVSTNGVVISSSSYAQYFITERSTNDNTRWIGTYENNVSGFDSVVVDDFSLKALTLSSLFRTTDVGTNNVVADVTIPAYSLGTQAGLVIGLDSADSPTSFLIAYLNGANTPKAIVEQATTTGGVMTYSTVVTAATAVWDTSAILRVVKDGTAVRLYYNNALIGTGTCSASITGTRVGLFSTYSGNTFDNFAVWPRSGYTTAPFDDLTVSHDTGVHYAGTGSAKLVSGGNDANFLQNLNVGGTGTYTFSAYVYKGAGQAVTTDDLNLYYDSGTITTSFTSIGNDWYYLSGTVTGENAPKNFGVRVKANKTVYLDNLMLYKTGDYSIYSNSSYFSANLSRIDSFQSSITTPGNSNVKFQFCANDSATCESGSTWQYWNGSAWAVATNKTTDTNTTAQLTQTVMQSLTVSANRKISVKAIMFIDGPNIPTLTSVTLGMTLDTTPPTNATNPLFVKTNGDKCNSTDDCWSARSLPAYEWTAGSDSSGLYGYCLYFGTNANGNPTDSKGKLGDSPLPTANMPCHFITGTTPSVDLGTVGFLASALSNSDTFVSEPNTYFLNIKALDTAGNASTDSVSIRFRYDGTRPTNVSYITTPSGNFSNVVDMNFAWPISGNGISEDSESGLLGWQYQLNSTSGTWKGTTHNTEFDLDYIPVGASSYQLTDNQDRLSIVMGTNIIYFRTVDISGNFSSDATMRTASLGYGGEAPKFGGSDHVTVTPDDNTTNSFALSWPEATPTVGQHVTHYYYSVNTLPASTYETIKANVGAYFDNGTSRTVSATALPNVNKNGNTVYVVAVDDATTPNYSPSNVITGTFNLDSSNPDNVGNLVASDSSIKSQSKWNVTLTWTAPVYQGAGNLAYQIYRSTNGTVFTQIGTSNGLSYVDNTPSSSLYYYKIVTRDGANAISTGTNTVMITPTGKWTSAPDLDSGPIVSNISTKKATISWTTSRSADSKVAYGKASGVYGAFETSSSVQTTGHSIDLEGLTSGTTYFYKAKWTDEDGNTGEAEEKMFLTSPPPTVKNISVTNIGLDYAVIRFTTTGVSSVKIYFGKSAGFGGMQELSTSPLETTYTAQITGLDDGTKYYYKINMFDSEGNEYDGSILDFTTLPRPYITDVNISEVTGTASTTMLVTWSSNTEISSIVTYYPEGQPSLSRDEVSVNRVNGTHRLILRGLLAHTKYAFIVKGIDRVGNEATSDTYLLTTSTDSRPPIIYNMEIQGSSATGDTTQLVVSWDTDEPATSQVEFGEGSGATYSQKTLEDSNLTYNHVIVITNLTPSKVYHIRAISKDSVGNEGKSVDMVTITPKSSDTALDLVISNLFRAFGF